MIKELITDLANGKIILSEALIRSKLIAFKINSETFKNWIEKEIKGYDYDDKSLPEYRKIYSKLEFVARFPTGNEQVIPFKIPETLAQEAKDTVSFHLIREPILLVELQVSESVNSKEVTIQFPREMTAAVKSTFSKELLFELRSLRAVERVERKMNILNFQNVLSQTKNKLLDILLELQSEFPNLENDYTMSEENNKKTENIITNNIYGGNVPLNIATGNEVNQSNSIYIENIDFEKLKELGVSEKEIRDLDNIIQDTKDDKKKLPGKIFGWLSGVTASMVARGVYENIPHITEYVSALIQ